MKNEFKFIAASLGLILPVSISHLGDAQASSVVDLSKSTILKNDVSKRILNFQVKDITGNVDNTMFAHTNHHTDVGGDHTNYHSNVNHSNNHTNTEQKNQCPSHVNIHSDRAGQSSHTDRGRISHTDLHTNKADDC